MSVSKEESLSPDEMRQKLYQTFKSRGMLDTLKTHLRNQLIQDLQRPRGAAVPHTHSVSVTACNSVIADHLRSAGYEYTLSVFLPECGMSRDTVLSSRDLLQLLKISPHTPLYTSLVSDIQSGQSGFLMSLFTELTDRHTYRHCCDTATQTSSITAHKESLVEKMQLIDEEYEVLRHRGERWPSVEARLAEFRKEIQEQAQLELSAQMQLFMDVEIARVKREEKEASRREILELRRDMERTHELKSEALMSREKNAIERLHRQQEIEEKDLYAQRQAVLKEMECVRSAEMELKLRTEAFHKSCALQEEKLKTVEDLLLRREVCVKSVEDSFQQRLTSEIQKYQLELKEDYTKRTETLTEQEKRIKAETLRLQKESADINANAEEHERCLSEVKRLQMELESAGSQTSLLTRENELMRERLESMSDYPALKKETQELQTHIRPMKLQLEEKLQENQRLKQELALQAEMLNTRAQEQQELETQRSVLHTQLQHEAQQCVLLKAQLQECEERTAWMNTHTHQLQLQLQHTQQALENEVLRKPPLLDRSVLSLSPDVYADSWKPRAPCAADVPEAGALRGRWTRPEHEHDSGLVTGALARIRELELEAERLEEAYRSHQNRDPRTCGESLGPVERLNRDPRTCGESLGPVERLNRDPRTCGESLGPVERLNRDPRTCGESLGPVERLNRDPRTCGESLGPVERLNRDPRTCGESLGPVERLNRDPRTCGESLGPVERLSRTASQRERDPLRLLSPVVSRSKRRAAEPDDQERRMISDSGRAALVFAEREREISPIPAGEMSSSRDFTHTHISPSSPRMKSTTRHSCSPPKLQESISSSSQESSPQPEKITLHDLTDPVQLVSTDQECFLEKLQDHQDVQSSSSSSSSSAVRRDQREEEEERKSREEEREMERLEMEMEDQNEKQAEDEREGHVTSPSSAIGGGADVANPLQKYMMMLMQDQSPKKEASEKQSQEDLLLSDTEHSVGVTSHEEPDDDFW